MNVDTLFSSFLHEISKSKTEKEVYKSLLKSLKAMLKYDSAIVMKNDEVVFFDPEKFDVSDYIDFMEWIKQRLLPAFFSDEEGYVGIIPIVKQGKMLGSIVVKTQKEPNNELMVLLQVFAFLTGITLENLILIEKIKNSEQFMFEVLNSINEGIFVLNKDGEIEFTNKFGKRILEKEDLEDYFNFFISDENNIFTKEFGGNYFTIVKTKFDFLGDEKYIIVFNNVTYEMELEKLKQLDKIKTEFVANISHELRTPLSAVKAYTETLLNMEIDPESQKEFLSIIYEQSERLESLLNDLLDFTLIDSGSMELEYSKFNICNVVDDVLKKLLSFAQKQDVKLEKECEDVEISADKRRIFQVIYNLVDNAIKFNDREKPERFVKILVKKLEDILIIEVEDNGIGIPKSEQEKIFEKFYKIDRSLTYEVPGTGMGLAIVKEIVRLHGGNIEVESEEKKGSIFRVNIPIRSE
ncbi:histidine kinase [Thermosipho melanesiensis]|uniref:histidine kinase n=2 Tax=Thermosipho melanesiensis TaxID=46541 RepID=A6LN40_THEM4|nr:HAMP domain-containing sensor histidine kinase [Thermosipho melanesiensis]ABR31341.1 histidine kinase [Thermosipho melanesiensis BI429]APT74401.1 histidine kinase [Thermosipho melanesiensis]OOC36364.1 histidine kinase [Thermosipho melanesiensis]OOC37182.1 histidine kinase [Thermosipho melanesiensis]OOC37934.1 histidine kinase [Thermosipho melanesiensis]